MRGWLAGMALVLMADMAAAGGVPMTIKPDPEASRISVVVDAGITRTRQLPSERLRQARRDMNAKKVVSDDDLRRLADYKDGLAALKYVELLEGRDPVGHASDIAYYGSIAVGAGRIQALDEMIEAMYRLDPVTEPASRKNQLIRVLYAHAWAGNALAMDAMIDMNGEGRLFGKLSERTRQKILQQAAGGDGRIELRLALALIGNPEANATDLALAKDYLERAVGSETLNVSVTAQTLMQLTNERQQELASATN